jgi:hypothetical protein
MRLLGLAVFVLALGADAPLRFDTTPTGKHVVASLSAELTERLPSGRLTQEQGESVVTLSLLADDKKPGPAMLGTYQRAGNELTFTPRLPLTPGSTYRASLIAGGRTTSLDYQVPRPATKSPPQVLKIYPTADVLPANHLRFYIYFDRPMRGGKELFQHLVLLDEKGKEIDEPWLVDEIWDEANNCLILFIHPGRIKWGVELRELMGPVLHDKRSYSLVVRGDWTDLDGNKIGRDTIKKFRTSAEDRVRIDLSQWRLSAPKAGTRESVTLTIPKSIDYISLQTGLTVTDGKDDEVRGDATVGTDEKSWRFTPTQPWQPDLYRVHISPDLEDVAGNTPARPFDMDLQAMPPPAQKLVFEFRPR